MSEIAKIASCFPLLSCWKGGAYWSGFITIHGRLIRLSLTVPKFPSIEEMKMEGDEEAKQVCAPIANRVQQLLSEGSSLSNFLSKFSDLLKKTLTINNDSSAIVSALPPDVYTLLLNEFDEIGLDKILYVSNNYLEIHAIGVDSGREHTVKFYLNSRYPHVTLKVIVDLPVQHPETFVWSNKITDSYLLFVNELKKYNGFWNEMDILDGTRVIDPAKPNRSHTFRRILIIEKVIMHIILNPSHPRSYPEIRLTGPDTIVESLDRLFEKDYAKWCESRSVLDNLQDIYQLEFLQKKCEEEKGIEEKVENNCTICYMYDLEGELPERTCVCSATFHSRCLFDLYINDFVASGKRYVDCPVCAEVLAGMKIFLAAVFLGFGLYYAYAKDPSTVMTELERQNLQLDLHNGIALVCVFLLNGILFKFGLNVLRGCREGADRRRAIVACRIWCWVEIFRMGILVLSILLDIYEQRFYGKQYLLQIPETLVLLFGWFLVNEYKKELLSTSQLPMVSITHHPNGFQPPEIIYTPPSVTNMYNGRQ